MGARRMSRASTGMLVVNMLFVCDWKLLRLPNHQKFWNARKQIETLYTSQRPITIKAEIFVSHTITISSS